MNYRIFAGICLLSLSATAVAAPITPAQALQRVSSSRKQLGAMDGNNVKLTHTALTATGTPAVYVFNRVGGKGYVMLSADDQAYPVLGYTDSGSFDSSDIAPAMQWWLDEYARQIEYAAARESVASDGAEAVPAASRASREAIAPMLKTHWDQVEPYNDMCPLSGALRTYTGCVATAMAQVMKYWEYPERGRGSISYTSESIGKKLTLNFERKAFDWDNMLDAYYPGRYDDTQADAVAYLMKACGYAVKMDYGTDSSGALAMMIRNGIVKYFNYDENARYELRMYYSSTDWEQMIYDNLKNVGPILYGGASTLGGGHSFVCDGYDGDGFFHFNWGWTGMSNGYYSLNALNPDALGSGGGGGGGYNFTQDAVLGIQPPTGKPVIPQPEAMTAMGSLTAEISDDSLKFDLTVQEGAMWVNYNPATLHIKFGARFEPQNGGESVYCDVSTRRWQIPSGYGTSVELMKPAVYLPEAPLADGTYKVSLATLALEEENPEWIPCKTLYGYYDYVTLSKAGDKYTVQSLAAPELKVTGGGFISGLYYGCSARLYVEVENTSDIELTGGFAPALSDGKALAFLGESVLLTVAPHSSLRHEWVTDLTQLQQYMSVTEPTTFYLSYMDEGSYKIYTDDFIKAVTMNPNPGAPAISLSSSIEVADAKLHRQFANGQLLRLYEITDPGNIEVSTSLSLESGYFAYPVMACIAQESEEYPGQVEVVTYAGKTLFLDDTDNKAAFATSLSYPQMDPDKVYNLVIVYGAGSSMYPVSGGAPTFVYIGTSGVGDVATDSSELILISTPDAVYAASASNIVSLTAYDISGHVVGTQAVLNGTSASLSLTDLPQGIIIVTARDAQGNIRTLKLAR